MWPQPLRNSNFLNPELAGCFMLYRRPIIGELVKLVSGGPDMVVVRLGPNDGRTGDLYSCTCDWFDDGELRTQEFVCVTLIFSKLETVVEIKDKKGKVIAKITAADPDASGCDEGLWVEIQADDGTRPTLCLVKGKANDPLGWYLGVYRDVEKTKGPCDFALSFGKNGPELQVTKGKETKSVNLFDLLEKAEV